MRKRTSRSFETVSSDKKSIRLRGGMPHLARPDAATLGAHQHGPVSMCTSTSTHRDNDHECDPSFRLATDRRCSSSRGDPCFWLGLDHRVFKTMIRVGSEPHPGRRNPGSVTGGVPVRAILDHGDRGDQRQDLAGHEVVDLLGSSAPPSRWKSRTMDRASPPGGESYPTRRRSAPWAMSRPR